MHGISGHSGIEREARSGDGPVVALIVLASAAWALCVWLGQYPGYTHFDTAEIFAWSRMGYVLNSGRHPPLLPWLVHTFDLAHPIGRHGLLLLAFANMALGAFAVWRVARLVVGPARALPALALYSLVPYATFLAMKLNHNSILISLWPLTVWAFIAALQRPSWWRGALFGVAAAAGVLAKYYVLLLLFAAVLASMWWPQRARFYSSTAPYVAVAVFCLLVGPHVYVSYIADADAFAQVFNDTGYQRRNPLVHAFEPGTVAAGSVLRLVRSNVLSVLAMSLAFVAAMWWQRGRDAPPEAFDRSSLAVLGILCAVPYALSLVLVAAFRLSASPEWMGPILALLPILVAGMLRPFPRNDLRRLGLACLAACLALPLAGPIALYVNFRNGVQSAVVPRVEIARDAAALWRQATGQPLAILGPEQGLSNTASLELAERPFSWPAFDTNVGWITPEMVDRHGVLIACVSNDPHCMKVAPPLIYRSTMLCELQHRRTLRGLQGPVFTTRLFLVPPKGMTLRAASELPGCREHITGRS